MKNLPSVPARAVHTLTKALLCLITSLPAAYATAVKIGVNANNSSVGTDAVDIQSAQASSSQAASGYESVAVGQYNQAPGAYSMALGYGNLTTDESTAVGTSNTLGGHGYAFGFSNTIDVEWIPTPYLPAVAVGTMNTLDFGRPLVRP